MDSHASEPPRSPSPSASVKSNPAETGQPTNTARAVTNKLLKNVRETPRHRRHTENRSHASGTMEEHRADVVEDLGHVPEVSLEYYKQFVLPHAAYQDHVEEIVQVLEVNGVLKAFEDESGLRWADFPNDPKDSGNTENETFKYMATIAAAIVKAALQVLPGDRQPTTVMECKPHEPAISEGRNGSFISDGHYRVLQSRRPKYFQNATSRTVVVATTDSDIDKLACDRPALEEYKRDDQVDDRNDNIAKLVGNASQAMYAKPTRRFMFGTTIENTSARFWFFSRAIVLTSEPFNFIKDYTHLIRYVLSLSFATEEELGYDLSVTRIAYPLDENPSAHTIQYDYRVGENTYRTIECLSSFRASGLLSRATRVWRVRQLNDPDHRECALKDVWIPSDAKTELEIQQEIFRSIEENCPEIDKEYRKHFMEILQCEVIQTFQKYSDDMPVFVRAPLEKNKEVTLHINKTAKGGRILSGTTVSAPTGGSYANRKDTPALNRLYKGRKHVRVVFADVGMPLSEVRQHDVLFTALANALKGLQYMSMGHYVHRDISAGNIILCNDGTAKISDLEYAKKFLSDGPQNDPKTGTPVYMAVEVQETGYFFLAVQNVKVRGKTPRRPIFLHNYLHHVESLFWVGLHALFSTIPTTYSEMHLTECGPQRQLFNSIFPHRLDGGLGRRHLFIEGDFQNAEDVLPVEYRPALEEFSCLGNALVNKYVAAYNKPNFPQHENFDSVYATGDPDDDLFSLFQAVADAAYNGDTQLLPVEGVGITVPPRVPLFREKSDNGDRADDQTYVDNGSDLSDGVDDEEPPHKMRRKGRNAKQKVSSRSTSVVNGSVGSAQSAGKRKRC
ncbi:uncharacterized protein EV420DRAFT_1330968 [Desarmillaria tabescens]|uniref:Fungal-type protein kinase domain-containing protein n=1 Tax=Armillaria tabescens TaxID=1929756 RepID=A0AA39TPJ0_ARMTA|nr:uncharacterized protein EV420DRAFT_1330968 [Desarmillaria tabescens]KAK0461953.1 hypothetical protein EV420DRAFT_1330968 [Desarmillaria tabescens]